jgi:phage-related protein
MIYRIDPDAIVIADVFMKTTRTTPKTVIEISQQRFTQYDRDSKE